MLETVGRKEEMGRTRQQRCETQGEKRVIISYSVETISCHIDKLLTQFGSCPWWHAEYLIWLGPKTDLALSNCCCLIAAAIFARVGTFTYSKSIPVLKWKGKNPPTAAHLLDQFIETAEPLGHNSFAPCLLDPQPPGLDTTSHIPQCLYYST